MSNLVLAIGNKYRLRLWRFLTKHRGVKKDAWEEMCDSVFDEMEDRWADEAIRQELIKIYEGFYNY
jgi:hypothetical protein